MKINKRIKGIILAITAATLWGVSGTVAQFLFHSQNFTAEWLVVIRLLATGIILISWGILKHNKNITRIWNNKSHRLKLISFSLLGMLGVQYTYFAAINFGNAATATILQYLSPIIITFYVAICTRKFPGINQIFCITLAILGTFFIITSGDISTLSISKAALFWGIASAFASAIYTLQPIELLNNYDSTTVVGWGMLIGGAAFSFIQQPWICTGSWNFYSMLGILFVVIFGTLIAFYCYLESLKYIKPTEASILGSMEPLSAALLSVLWLHVPYSIFDFIGTLCIIIPIGILLYAKK